MKLTQTQRFFCHSTFFALLFSGIIWLILDRFVADEPSLLIYQVWCLRLHGLASFGFLIAFGMILSTHISFNWRVKKNRRKSGIILVALLVILISSGYGLYYLGAEEIRCFISYLHWILGIFCSAVFATHFLTKKPKRKL